MSNTFLATLIFIALYTIIGAFVKGRSRDKYLMSFKGSSVTLKRAGIITPRQLALVRHLRK